MKAERRHELQHNSLDAELGKTVKFFKDHSSKIVVGVTLVVFVIAAGIFAMHKYETARVEPRIAFDKVMSNLASDTDKKKTLSQLEVLSRQTGNPDVAAMSLLEIGRIHTDRYVTDPLNCEGDLKEARDAYTKVADGDSPTFAARGKLGLGTLAECEGNLDLARKQYQSVIDMKGTVSVGALDAATENLAVLDKIREPVVLSTVQPSVEEVTPLVKPVTGKVPVTATTRPSDPVDKTTK